MSVAAPPEQVRPEELEALIREARARQRRRTLRLAVAVGMLSAIAFGADAIVSGSHRPGHAGGRPAAPATKTGAACGVRVVWTKILAGDGRVLYREPARRTMGHQLRCSGASIWVVFFNGAEMSQEAYFGVHSSDGGRTWRPAFTERYFGLKAPHQLVTGYLGPWTLDGPRRAYFVGECVACGFGKVSLWVTRDDGRTFRRYPVPWLKGSRSASVHVPGRTVTISAHRVEVS